ncbi:hypothetical protein DV515_00014634 [Chloebia gouldiae]|uniref:Uncharacterized protein n=1 Tax=Chloebia gouldiae TaxID=44316 RepID=A0A3L8RXJ6_CHLGU|nr:hypothetical protein DV515_00014634 [Chloebia gouldiae]
MALPGAGKRLQLHTLLVTTSKSGVHIYFSFKEHLGTAAVRGVSIFSGVEVGGSNPACTCWVHISVPRSLLGTLSSGHICSLPCPAGRNVCPGKGQLWREQLDI